MPLPLADLSVVITGAGRAIGSATAIEAARLGAAVMVNDIERDKAAETVAAIKATGGRAIRRDAYVV